MSLLVVKFGGTSVGNMERVRRNAEAVARELRKGNSVIVVVSAMGHTTDSLIKIYRRFSRKIDPERLDFVMALGERLSARIFARALKDLGVESRPVDPLHREWPVITDSRHGVANIDLEETERRVRKYIAPLVEKGVVPVICGFLGRDRRGKVTTIGRGGSDTTAFVIGKCVSADLVLIVTDVDGVMSADPNLVSGTKLVEEITVEEMRDLARFGAQVMHPRAMNYKSPEIEAKVINFRWFDLGAPGTKIIGPFEKPAEVRLYPEPLAMVTVVGEQMQTKPGILVRVAEPVSRAGINIFGVSIGPRSFSLYVKESEAEKAVDLVHQVVREDPVMKSVTVQKGLAMIITESEKFIYTPGVIAKLAKPVGEAGINIIEILSSRASISFFVDWEVREKALRLFEKAMREM
jgi:aspartate kinase